MGDNNIVISVLSSDLLDKKFSFWNDFKVILYNEKILSKTKTSFGINYEEKWFQIDQVDSIHIVKRYNWKILIVAFILSIIIASIGAKTNSTEGFYSFSIIVFSILLIYSFIGQKYFVISSKNDKVEIRFSTLPKKELDSFTEKVLYTKSELRKHKSITNINISNDNTNIDFSSKIRELKTLLDKGLITNDEFELKRKEIINRI